MIWSLKILMKNVMLQNSINLMVQPEISPVNYPLSTPPLAHKRTLSTGGVLARSSWPANSHSSNTIYKR